MTALISFHAVMIGECGEEFGVSLQATSRADAYEQLEEDYPESRVCQLEDTQQSREREARTQAWAEREYDEGHGRPGCWGDD